MVILSLLISLLIILRCQKIIPNVLLLEENSEDFEEKMVNILMNIYNSDALLSSKVKNLIELDKKNAIDNFLTHILHNNGLTNK